MPITVITSMFRHLVTDFKCFFIEIKLSDFAVKLKTSKLNFIHFLGLQPLASTSAGSSSKGQKSIVLFPNDVGEIKHRKTIVLVQKTGKALLS